MIIMKKIALISCVKTKLPHKAKAKDLYISPLFKGYMAYAMKQEPDKIFILSAKYGLLDLDTEIEPYEFTLKGKPEKLKKEWAHKVLRQLSERADIQKDHFIILAGNDYRTYLIPYLSSYEVPLEGVPFFTQLKRLKELLDE